MLSPFAGMSLITHLFICLLYKILRFFRGLFFGFKKKTDENLTLLVRARNETILPAVTIGSIFSIIAGIAFFSIGLSYRSKPNTFDLVESALGNLQAYETPKAIMSAELKSDTPQK